MNVLLRYLFATGIALVCVSPVLAAATFHDAEVAVAGGDLPRASAVLRAIVMAQPDNAHAHFYLAEVLDQEGKHGDALTELGTAQRLDPALSFSTPERFATILGQVRAHVPGPAGLEAASGSHPITIGAMKNAPGLLSLTRSTWVGMATVLFAALIGILLTARALSCPPEEAERRRQLARVAWLAGRLKKRASLTNDPDGLTAVLVQLSRAEATLRQRMVSDLHMTRLEQEALAPLGEREPMWPRATRLVATGRRPAEAAPK